ncbi:DUF4260 family protein [Hymenobacter sp. UV11]|uniref:DUF4260 family protein n=1 Tax=Hymenobacter sp. UV11 TaxID=1849735 RepID=UPI00105B4304|nr:DUF4260 family protein [Hymenobacter sp. UV11]TDN37092.1 hypothetical protein A8B98_04995 [Hymenobacter sp. UV11]TFZ67790.1 DUF4260 family protein [Hymenobacter sp. UV11]
MKTLLTLDEAASLLLALLVFAHLPYAWWWLPALFLVPDLSMLGYLAGPRSGAYCYNFMHHKLLALALAAAGWGLGQPALLLAGVVLLFHISFDRVLGYGFKFSSGFQDTHLSRTGKQPVAAAVA